MRSAVNARLSWRPSKPRSAPRSTSVPVLGDVARLGAERPAEERPVANEHKGAHRWCVQPLVRIEGDRVRPLDAAQKRRQLVRDGGGAAVAGIDVQPGSDACRDVGDRVDRVDRACAGGARRRHDRHRTVARREIGVDQTLEFVGAHREPVVDRHLADGRLSEPEHVGGASDGEVRLRGDVHPQGRSPSGTVLANRGIGAVAGELEGGEVGERAATDERSAGLCRQPEALCEPADELELDLRRRGREHPAADVGVQSGGEQICDRAGHGAGAADVGEEPAASGPQRVVEHHLEVGEERVVVERLLRHLEADRPAHARRRHWRARGRVGKPGEIGRVQVEDPVGERPRPLRRPVEVADGRRRLDARHGAP